MKETWIVQQTNILAYHNNNEVLCPHLWHVNANKFWSELHLQNIYLFTHCIDLFDLKSGFTHPSHFLDIHAIELAGTFGSHHFFPHSGTCFRGAHHFPYFLYHVERQQLWNLPTRSLLALSILEITHSSLICKLLPFDDKVEVFLRSRRKKASNRLYISFRMVDVNFVTRLIVVATVNTML